MSKGAMARRLTVPCGHAAGPIEPASGESYRAPDHLEWLRDVQFGEGGGRPLHLHLLRPRVRAPALSPCLVWIHGGAFRTGSRDSGLRYLPPFAEMGWVCASIEYRLSGEAIWPAQIEDCKCAIRFLRSHSEQYGLDPHRIGVWGSSAGGHLVAMLGTTGRVSELEGTGGWPGVSSAVQAVCDWYGPTDFLRMDAAGSEMVHDAPDSPESELVGGAIQLHPERVARANPISYVAGDEPPFLIVHGTRDPLVPYNQSELLFSALAGRTDVTFITVEGAGHGGLAFETAEVMAHTQSFLVSRLGPAR